MLWIDGFLWASFVFLPDRGGRCLADIVLQTYHNQIYFDLLIWSFHLIILQAIAILAFFFCSAANLIQSVHVWVAILLSFSLVKFKATFPIFPLPFSSFHQGSIDAVSPFLQIPCDTFQPKPYVPPSLGSSLLVPHLTNLLHHALLLYFDCSKSQAASLKIVSSSFTQFPFVILHLITYNPSVTRLFFSYLPPQLPQD